MAGRTDDAGDEVYYERLKQRRVGFDENLLGEPLTALPVRAPLIVSPVATATEAMRAMQGGHRGCVLVTDDGTGTSKLVGIFTERDVLLRIVDKGRNPRSLCVREVMTQGPKALPVGATVGNALKMMSIGYRHVPVLDDECRVACVVSVRDIVDFLVEAFPREVLNLPLGDGPPRAREGA
ncbi:MAG: CBS domain-containing protein [Myxococcota bacterium]|jgi:CBS domain-containing protein|nr:hypothetical protein [Deltaproteobacteria bacterium]MCP4241561.1 CBS domain-containing protein [bacterium]MDP7075067.1 CBS domain-containing protein [Myxococcota bacterium]MDP7299873.1 CBS domain-containing protein [Myxococcota bacterium]MDP7432510.1 CBS domain-containing protein [Myxococcota bacterium]